LPADAFFADSFDYAADTLNAMEASHQSNTKVAPHE
jgi:hypothetical protein